MPPEEPGGQDLGSFANPPTTVATNTPTFGSDDLVKMHTRLQTVIRDVDELRRKVEQLGASSQRGFLGRLFGGGRAPTTLSVGAVTGGPSPGGGGGGSTLTTGNVTGALGLAAMGEIAAQTAGRINTGMAGIQAGGMGINLLAFQRNIQMGVGGGGAASTITAGQFTGIQNLGPADLARGLAIMQQTPWLWSGRGFGAGAGLMNKLQGMNPLLGAQGSAQAMAQMVSPQVLNNMLMYGGPNAGALTVGGRFNSTPQMLRSLLTTATFNQNLSPQQARNIARNPAEANMVSRSLQNLGVPQPIIQDVLQYAGAGMNYKQAFPQNAVATAALGASTAGTKMGQDIFQATAGLQSWFLQATASVRGFTGALARANPGVTEFVAGAGKATSGFLHVAEQALLLASAFKYLNIGTKIAGAQSFLGGLNMSGGGLLAGAGKLLGGGALALGGSALAGWAGSMISGGQKTGARSFAGTEFADIGKGAAIGGGLGLMVGVPWLGAGVGAAIGGLGGLAHHLLGDPPTNGMQPTLASGVSAMMRDNPNLQVNSGRRSNAQQAALYALKGGKGVAKPGRSKHQTGQAVDIGPKSQLGWVMANAPRYGLYNPSRSEPWHLEAMGDNTSATITHETLGGLSVASGDFLSSVKALRGFGGGAQARGGIGGGGGGGSSKSSGSSSGGASSTGTATTGSDTSLAKSAVAQSILGGIGVSGSAVSQDLNFMLKWMALEGGNWNNSAKYNPMNTSLLEPGSVNYNTGKPGSGVQAYTSWAEGLQATISTLTESRYSGVVSDLQAGNVTGAAQALVASPWDAGHYGGNWQQFVGDPKGSVFSARRVMGGSGIGSVTLNMPLQVVGATQQDAQMLAQMVLRELQKQGNMKALGS